MMLTVGIVAAVVVGIVVDPSGTRGYAPPEGSPGLGKIKIGTDTNVTAWLNSPFFVMSPVMSHGN